ncbi:MAG TPA: hypothetical protein VF666_00110 [Pyrinomonadaceae bacterium]|jgi:hypothetical protein
MTKPLSRLRPHLGVRPLFCLRRQTLLALIWTALVAVSLLLLSVTTGEVLSPVVAAASQNKAGAQKVSDDILGVRVGSRLDEVHDKLKSLGTFGGRDTRDGGRKEAWTLKKTDFTSIAYKTDASGKVVWVTGYVRPGREIAFAKFGDLAQAYYKSEQSAVWNIERPEGNFRLIAKGGQGKARVVHLLSLTLPPM